MLSVVVVGRNDNHGYNLGKRVANSLNSISMRLSDGDELIFVDWNTPRPFPPMPVSIIDDLTPETLKYLRILVVSPKLHELVKGKSTKQILEPIARNVGIRRAKISNEWILSTNTDMLFVGEKSIKFRNIIEKLDKRMWQSFRYEIPEYMWERFDKRDPVKTNSEILELAHQWPIRLKLSTHPTSREDSELLFADAVGDFQLAPAEMWRLIQGFPEEMLMGWHVDSRAAVQMIRKSGKESKCISQEHGLETFHQNHLRSLTHFHLSSSINTLDLIEKPYENDLHWGMKDFDIPTFDLNSKLAAVGPVFLSKIQGIEELNVQQLNRDAGYTVERSITFLMDELTTLGYGERVGVLSANENLVDILCKTGTRLGFTVQGLNSSEIIGRALEFDLVIIDFGIDYRQLRNDQVIGKAFEINNSVSLIARNLPSGQRVALLRAQNWAIRSLVSRYFKVPLFNNYSGLLVGNKKQIVTKWDYLETELLRASVRFEFGQGLDRSVPLMYFYLKLKKYLPKFVKNYIRKKYMKVKD